MDVEIESTGPSCKADASPPGLPQQVHEPRCCDPDGTVTGAYVGPPDNGYGVLDHEILTPSGATVYVPLRAIADGDGCEVVFTLRRSPGMTDAEFERDTSVILREGHR